MEPDRVLFADTPLLWLRYWMPLKSNNRQNLYSYIRLTTALPIQGIRFIKSSEMQIINFNYIRKVRPNVILQIIYNNSHNISSVLFWLLHTNNRITSTEQHHHHNHHTIIIIIIITTTTKFSLFLDLVNLHLPSNKTLFSRKWVRFCRDWEGGTGI